MKTPVIPPLTLDKFNSVGEIYPIFPDEVDCIVGIDSASKEDFTVEKEIKLSHPYLSDDERKEAFLKHRYKVDTEWRFLHSLPFFFILGGEE